jgi:hypothetical protein
MKIRALAAAAVLALGGTYAAAGTTSVNFASDVSQHHLGSFTGTATYDSTDGKLTLVVQNTSPTAKGGFLTAFAFDIAGNSVAKYDDPDGGHKPNTNGFDDIRNKKGIVNAAPFGKYEAGAGLDGKWMPGGIKRGIAAGASDTFVFDVSGTGASSLTVADFFSGGKTGLNIVATFKGMKHNRSDRAGGIMSGAVSTLDSLATGGNLGGNTGGNNTGNGSNGSNLPPTIDNLPPGNGIPPGDNNGGGTTAVPVPAAAWTGLTTFALIGVGALRRKIRRAIA